MSTSEKAYPLWAFFSLVTNVLLMLGVILLIWQQQRLNAVFGTIVYSTPESEDQAIAPKSSTRHQLNYQQWLDILQQEAEVAAKKRPQHLTILAGDSISLWFPPQLLPENRSWLNQGISGETSDGLLRRLNLFDRTQPESILVMIGINDLIRGVSDEVILDHQQQIISYLQKAHPKVPVVVQSILPHGAEAATWEGREKLLAIPNSRIRQLNQKLQAIATKKGAQYLDLYPLFANQQGNLHFEFTTDGLHLNSQGYIVWRTALQMQKKL
ncbi:SGNH/GDSL hydrolase family protein [Fortiea contorta]|uniref:SGNH/GDSL hydrolase family protein n=1 Tax=Fortiea contorta TaxID=1892405 RepID=UPI000476A98F|nr:SGNH/GDSL hydrolase family protein [Fortiea contorta]